MSHKERDLSLNQRARKTAAKIGVAVMLGGAAITGISGCNETKYSVPHPNKTGETMILTGEQYALYETIKGTPETSEAAGTPSSTTTTAVESTSTTSTTIQNKEGVEVAQKSGDTWKLKNPDGQEVYLSLPEGFSPDKDLVIQNDLKMNDINNDLSVYKDWDNVIHKVAGYNYDENDFSGNVDFLENVQGDMWAWRVIQGEEVEVPGIGHLKGDERTSVVVLVLNLQPRVIAWDKDGLGPVFCKHGFTATGRIWDAGTPEKIAETEELLGGHWLFRQKEGTPEKSYIGVTDDPENAKRTLYVSVAYRQWGNNEDGTPREQFQLLNAKLVDFNK